MTANIAQLNQLLAGRYRVQREVGAGGMATVYLAEDAKHHRNVAIKVLRSELTASVGGARFLREIEIAAQLQHPNILPLLDSGEAGGLLYYVMPFVEGPSLRERLDREHALPVGDVIRLLIDLLDGLAHAHASGVVHRDIKPDNIMLSGRHALVTDFGVARAVSEATGGTITTLGIALGTPAYMSPEQATADPAVDHRTDIYAVGLVAYEMLAGRLPFSGRSPQQTLAAQVTATPEPVTTHRPNVPPVLAQAVMRCLEKQPADRWQSAAELLAVLEPLAAHGGGPASIQTRLPDVPSARGRWWPRLAGVATVVALAGAVVLAPRSSRPSWTLGKAAQLTTDAGLQIDPALSPDGKFVAYAAGTSASMRIYVRPIGGGRTIALTDDSTTLEVEPRWSPDGTQIMFLTRGGVSVAPALGGVPHRVIAPSAASVSTASWSSDGREVVFARGDSVLRMRLDDQSTRVVFVNGRDKGPHSCRWSPTGALIACVLGNRQARAPGALFANKAPSTIVVVSATGGTPVAVTRDDVLSQSPEWSPDGDRLYFISNRDGTFDAYEAALDARGQRRAELTRLTTGLNARSLSIATSAPKVAYGVYSERANIDAVPIPAAGPVEVTNAVAVTTGVHVIESVRTSRDGKWLVYDSDQDGKSNLYRVSTAGGAPEQLTHESFDVFAPDLSPDGTLVAYHSWRTGNRDIEVRPLEGGDVQFVTRDPMQESHPVWAPDGKALLFMRRQEEGAPVYVTKPLGAGRWSTPRRILSRTGQMSYGADWSPDGQWIVAVSNGDIVETPADSGPVRAVAHVASGEPPFEDCRYSADGRTIYCKSHDARGHALIYAVSASGGRSRVILSFPDLTRPSYRPDFAVGPTQLYFVMQDRQSNVWVADIIR